MSGRVWVRSSGSSRYFFNGFRSGYTICPADSQCPRCESIFFDGHFTFNPSHSAQTCASGSLSKSHVAWHRIPAFADQAEALFSLPFFAGPQPPTPRHFEAQQTFFYFRRISSEGCLKMPEPGSCQAKNVIRLG